MRLMAVENDEDAGKICGTFSRVVLFRSTK